MPPFSAAALTMAEIAAAEAAAAAAAQIAAQAAATQAATAAATQAAAATAAEAALAPALTEVAATTLPEVAGSVLPEAATGILEAAPGVVPPPATPLPPAGLEQVASAGSTPLPPAGELVGPPTGLENVGGPSLESATLEPVELGPIEYQTPPTFPEGTAPSAGIEQIQTASGPATSDVASYQADKQLLEAARNFTPGPEQQLSNAELYASGNYTGPQTYADMPGHSEAFSFKDSLGPVDQPELLNSVAPESNSFMEGLKSVSEYIDKNPFKSGAAAYMGLQYSGALNQEQGATTPQPRKFNNPYRLSPNFRGGPYSEPNVYKPKYAAQGGIMQSYQAGGPVERMSMANTAMNPQGGLYPQGMIDKTQYATPTQRPVSAELMMEAPAYERSNPMLMASGGVARYANEGEVEEDTARTRRRYRGDLMGTLDKYNEMIEGKKSGSLPTGRADPYTGVVGTFEDSDIDTRLQNADVAAMTRLKKAGKRANVGIAAIPMGVQAGSLNLPTNAAGGGIMQANLGSYAAGGNPRLLRGPGDGMSDNIPATIGGKQPARLADGEFVVPADVVSHLGNGSTAAGAKKLHAMMDKVRMDRTGKKKQAPAVKAKKYIPK
jgi:hypothetical protein